MTKEKDLGSDAARSDPDTAARDREELRRRAERNIERSGGKQTSDGTHPVREAAKDGRETIATRTGEPKPEPVDEETGARLRSRGTLAGIMACPLPDGHATSWSLGRPCAVKGLHHDTA